MNRNPLIIKALGHYVFALARTLVEDALRRRDARWVRHAYIRIITSDHLLGLDARILEHITGAVRDDRFEADSLAARVRTRLRMLVQTSVHGAVTEGLRGHRERRDIAFDVAVEVTAHLEGPLGACVESLVGELQQDWI